MTGRPTRGEQNPDRGRVCLAGSPPLLEGAPTP